MAWLLRVAPRAMITAAMVVLRWDSSILSVARALALRSLHECHHIPLIQEKGDYTTWSAF
jgi:hypothetical protein